MNLDLLMYAGNPDNLAAVANDARYSFVHEDIRNTEWVRSLLEKHRPQEVVHDPGQYGVFEFDVQRRAISLEEKPAKPRSRDAVTGIYFYDAQVAEVAKSLKLSLRGEMEMTDVNRWDLEQWQLTTEIMSRGRA